MKDDIVGQQKSVLRSTMFYLTAAGLFLFAVFPVVWMVSTAFKHKNDIFSSPPKFIFELTLSNFHAIFTEAPILHYLKNTVIISVTTTIFSILIGVFAAYALARFRFKGKEDLAFYILSIRMFPPIAAAIPIFVIMKNLNLLDTRLSLIIAYTTFNLPFVVWMLRDFIESLPHEIEEAAMVDGKSRMGAFFDITFPLLLPSIAAVSILCLIFSWNEFLFALILSQRDAKTLALGLTEFMTWREIGWGNIFATATILVGPVILFSFLVQKYLVRGLTMGAVRQ
jgi:multiple sugar transport system permease protein